MDIFAEWPESQLRLLYVAVALIVFPVADFAVGRAGDVARRWSRWGITILFVAIGACHFAADAKTGNVASWFVRDVVYSTPDNQKLYDDGYRNKVTQLVGRPHRRLETRYVKHPWTSYILGIVIGVTFVRYRDRTVEINPRSSNPMS